MVMENLSRKWIRWNRRFLAAGFHVMLPLVFTLVFAMEGAAQFEFDEPWPPKIESLPVEGELSSGGTVDVSLKVSPEAGIHVYRDKIQAAFEVQAGVSFEEMVLPEGIKIPDILEEGKTIEVLEGEFLVRLVFNVTAAPGEAIEIKGTLNLQGCTDEVCYAPHGEGFTFAGVAAAGAGGGGAAPPVRDKGAADRDTAVVGGVEGPEAEPSLGEIILAILTAFGVGIGLSLTPCVLPIIPITSAVILRHTKGGIGSALFSSCIYVLGLAVTYAIAGVAVAFVGGTVRSFLGSPYVLGTIAGVFVLLSLSMFGLFDITMPSSVTTRIQQRTAKGGKGPLGLLAMGALSGLVIGPCITGPIVATLIKIAEWGNPVIGFSIMFAMAWGMGLLIIAAGTFTGMVPKAGAWMEWFKKFFGFVLLWGALYFLKSVIGEIAYQVGTMLLLVTSAVFLGGLDSLPSDAGWGLRLKKLLGVLCLMGAFFLGLQTFSTTRNTETPENSGPAVAREGFIPGDSVAFEAALAEGKPTVLYFTASWCDLCKSLKKKVLSHPDVIQALKGFAALKIDVDESTDLRDRFKVLGPPTLVFFDREGKERKDLRFSGVDKTAEEFIRLLQRL